ncbi:MAG TPA: copper-binding protein [Blastocatellia bacterium]|jgi:protein SCO1/2|nr:copper-binding protein [Blastocatellia bacterium]
MNSTYKTFALALACLSIYSTLAGCRLGSKEPQQRYELKGKVLNVDRKGATVTIAHDAIPGYMEAMAMPFSLKDERDFKILAPDDRVRATLVVAGSRSWLEDLVVTRESPDTSTVNAANSAGPKPGDEVPDFSLINQDGRRIGLHKYRGQALVLTFIYTRCPLPDYCPLMTDQFAEIDKALRQDPGSYPKAHLLSISVDPAYDTPEVMREYGARYAGGSGPRDFERWEFATGSEAEVRKAATYFGMQYWQEEGQIIHLLRTAVIAPDGKLAKLYNGNEWKPAEVLSELQSMGTGGLKADNLKADNLKADNKDRDKIYYGVGVIEEIHSDRATVQINHEDIKDFMPAMSMPYAVKDAGLLDSFAVGDRIKFGLQSTPAGLVVVEMEKR